MKYFVTVNDCCGEFDGRETDTFEGLLAAYHELVAKYAGKRQQTYCFGSSECEYSDDQGWYDGLTDDEREATQALPSPNRGEVARVRV